MSDPEVDKINQKKLKDKGAKIVEAEQKVNYESVLIQMSQYLNDTGLEMMNVSTQIRKLISDERQKRHTKLNTPDSEKS